MNKWPSKVFRPLLNYRLHLYVLLFIIIILLGYTLTITLDGCEKNAKLKTTTVQEIQNIIDGWFMACYVFHKNEKSNIDSTNTTHKNNNNNI